MRYILLKKINPPGYGNSYSAVVESDDITRIKDEIVKRTRDGAAVRDFRIVSEIDFELTMVIQLKENSDEKEN